MYHVSAPGVDERMINVHYYYRYYYYMSNFTRQGIPGRKSSIGRRAMSTYFGLNLSTAILPNLLLCTHTRHVSHVLCGIRLMIPQYLYSTPLYKNCSTFELEYICNVKAQRVLGRLHIFRFVSHCVVYCGVVGVVHV